MKLLTKLMAVLLTAVFVVAVPLCLVGATSDAGRTPLLGPVGSVGEPQAESDGLANAYEARVASSEVWVKPERSTVMPNNVFTVEVWKNTAEALGAFDLYVTWDVSQLRFVDARRSVDVDAGGVFSTTLEPKGSPAPSILHVTALLPGAELMAAGEGAMVEIDFEAIDTGTSLVDVIDEEDAAGVPVYEAVRLVDTDQNSLPTPVVTDGTVVAGVKVFLPLVLRGP